MQIHSKFSNYKVTKIFRLFSSKKNKIISPFNVRLQNITLKATEMCPKIALVLYHRIKSSYHSAMNWGGGMHTWYYNNIAAPLSSTTIKAGKKLRNPPNNV